ncbi:MAG: cob(I)yrinic acid a,c-diamide adenosyltransferase [Clostridia bacterium]
MIHVYMGDGKGKTTAAIGLAVRHAGSGGRVLFVQFMKCMDTGELHVFDQLEAITVLRNTCRHGFSFAMTDQERMLVTAAHNENLAKASTACRSGRCTLLVLDEIASAYALNLIDRDAVDALVDAADMPELVLTGRDPSAHMLERADYITEMKLIRHPYTIGIQARRGIEF